MTKLKKSLNSKELVNRSINGAPFKSLNAAIGKVYPSLKSALSELKDKLTKIGK